MERNNLQSHNEKFREATPQDIFKFAFDHFGAENLVIASSMSAEDQILTDIAVSLDKDIMVLTLDTGRLPQETYNVIQKTETKYGIKIKILFPTQQDVEDMVMEYGVNLFYDSVEDRKLCCRIRKIDPLKRVLPTKSAWFCGLRKEQAPTRTDLHIFEYDENFGLFKINPIANWTSQDVWDYIKKNNVPYNTLHDKGFPSIGCQPCTRAVKSGEDIRAGRWWWETPEQKECGLHFKDGKLQQIKKN